MRWVVKVTESAGQVRITLPKAFCELYNIAEAEYMVIDDRDQQNITIGRLIYGGKREEPSEDGRNGTD